MHNSKIINHNPQSVNDPASKVVIWLHGLGASGDDFVPIVPELGMDFAVKFIFPHAPNLPVTINGGYVMPAWYDIMEMGDISRKVDLVQINASSERIIQIIQAQIDSGILPQNIIIAGFSQGGAVAYHVALKLLGDGVALGGLLALSTYFASGDEFGERFTGTLPILIQHGTMDDMVSPYFAKMALDKLSSLGLSAEYQEYPMAHQVCAAQIQKIGNWLTQCLNL